ncbi:MAG: helix-turn-helix transcriptional regulator [Acetobacteraceae bacterium]|nr:helix-turn-helix transcriptional regulator [Acetobacteraceae bacterium]
MDVTEADAVEAVYAAAIAPDQWPAALQRIGRAFDCHFVCNLTRRVDRTAFRAVVQGVDTATHLAFLRRSHRDNPVGSRMAAMMRPGTAMRVSDALPRTELVRTALFAEYFEPNGLHHGLRMELWRSGPIATTMSLMRREARGDFDAAELATAQRLIPHLQRAIAVNQHLRAGELVRDAAFAALDRLRQAVMLLDSQGLVMHANRNAAALLAAGGAVRMIGRTLVASDQGAAGRCAAVLGRALPGRTAVPRAGALMLPRPDGAPPLTLVAMPLASGAGWEIAVAPSVLVCLHDPLAASRPSLRMLREVFGLTQSEAMLAGELMAGRAPREIAAQSRRSLPTVRSHLARLLAKTGADRQATLLQRLGTLPDDDLPDGGLPDDNLFD